MEDEGLAEILELTRENNKILRGMRRSARVAGIFRVFYWLVILGAIFGSYYYLQPYIDQALSTYEELRGKVNSLPDASKISVPADLVKQLDALTKNK